MNHPRFMRKVFLFCPGRNVSNNLLMWLVDSSSLFGEVRQGGHLLMRDQIQEMRRGEEWCCF
ncbi:hypothetical protein E2562_012091 [Oryza meyeriana var. granulata]|uniref:Uncharacterized protein n=1 Tax=Oryza meyeriana var. granulata TaxID=110450 RepID=A0A6G1F784_9ORYZ|nr:hypothetical protein E2562_012091 [Oryza meyeriana var. granulata]